MLRYSYEHNLNASNNRAHACTVFVNSGPKSHSRLATFLNAIQNYTAAKSPIVNAKCINISFSGLSEQRSSLRTILISRYCIRTVGLYYILQVGMAALESFLILWRNSIYYLPTYECKLCCKALL